VKPTDNSLHTVYTFWVRATASDGGSTGILGSYTLHVGCTADTVTYSDDPAALVTQYIYVGQALTSAYTFNPPLSTKPYCVNLNNEIMNPDGATWTGTAKLTPQTA